MVFKSLSTTLYPIDATRVRYAGAVTVTDRSYSRPGRGLSIQRSFRFTGTSRVPLRLPPRW